MYATDEPLRLFERIHTALPARRPDATVKLTLAVWGVLESVAPPEIAVSTAEPDGKTTWKVLAAEDENVGMAVRMATG
jgi:hypothetical protein